MKLSEHVSLEEFEFSQTAVKNGYNNSMNEEQIECAKALCENIFEPVRKFRGKAISLSSGFRGSQLNKAVGGSSSSQHCKGQAIDVKLTVKEFHLIKDNLDFDQLIWEFGTKEAPQWVHVSYDKNKTKQRGQVLRALKVGGRTKYINFDL